MRSAHSALLALFCTMLCSGVAATPTERMDAWLQQGEAARRLGEAGGDSDHFQDAARAFRRALAIAPGHPEASYGLASVSMRLGDTEVAAHTLELALARHPRDATLYNRLGYVYRYAGYLDTSIAAYRRSANLDPSLKNLIRCREQIVKALMYQGAYAAALDEFDRIHQLYSRHGKPTRGKTLLYEGLNYLYLNEAARAKESLLLSREREKNSLWGRFAQSYLYLIDNNRSALRSLALQLENDKVSDGERRYRLVQLFTALNETERALSHLEKSIAAGNVNTVYFKNDPLLTHLRNTDRFDALLGRAEQRHKAFPPTSHITQSDRSTP